MGAPHETLRGTLCDLLLNARLPLFETAHQGGVKEVAQVRVGGLVDVADAMDPAGIYVCAGELRGGDFELSKQRKKLLFDAADGGSGHDEEVVGFRLPFEKEVLCFIACF